MYIQKATHLLWRNLRLPIGNQLHLKPTSINRLNQNFPNPFNPETWIPYQLASDAKVVLHIYDPQGRRIYSQTLGHQKAGSHTAYWDGRNTAGESVASGVYFYSLEAGTFQATPKNANPAIKKEKFL